MRGKAVLGSPIRQLNEIQLRQRTIIPVGKYRTTRSLESHNKNNHNIIINNNNNSNNNNNNNKNNRNAYAPLEQVPHDMYEEPCRPGTTTEGRRPPCCYPA